MNGRRFVKKLRRKSEHIRDLFPFRWMKAPSYIISSFASTSFCLIVFLFCLHFYFKRNFEIIRCIVTSLIAIQHTFVKVQLKIEKMKSVFWAREFGRRNWYTGLPNGLDTSLQKTYVSFFEIVKEKVNAGFVVNLKRLKIS